MKNKIENNQPGLCSRSFDIAAYLLNALPADERAEFERHLAQCPACSEMAANLRTVIERMRRLPGKTAGRDLSAEVLSKIPPDAWSGRRRPVEFVPAMLKIAAVLVVAVGLTAFLAFFLAHINAKTRLAVRGPEIKIEKTAAVAGQPAPAGLRPAGAAAKDALAWLQRAQDQDGGWSGGLSDAQKPYAQGISALALMAFMENDPNAFSGPHADAIRRGIGYLVANQNEDGLIGPGFSGQLYNQGLATLAIIEACARETNQAWRAAAERALPYICRAQTDSGGWSYRQGGPATANISVSIWPLQTLIRADALGYPSLRPSIEQGLAWLKQMVNRNGQMDYSRPDDFPYVQGTMTAASVVCFLTANKDLKHPSVQAMISSVRRSASEKDELLDYYRLYLMAEALDLSRDGQSAQIAGDLRARLASLQTRGGLESGSWNANDRWSNIGGRVYATAMATLALGYN